jgi:hypothetical protein
MLPSCAPSSAPVPGGPAPEEIQPAQLAAHLEFLSHDLLEGRAPSTRGGDLAAQYLAAQLALIGFAPGAADGTYFQQVPVVESVVDPSYTLRVGTGVPFKYLQDVVAFSGVQDAKVVTDGEVVFVGHGIVAPEYNWNDYEGVDVKGKVALVMVNDPPATADEPLLFAGPALTYYGRWTYKFEEAARQGAAGAILIHTDESATYPWQVVQSSWSGTQYSLPPQPGQPSLQLKAWVTNATAVEIARRAGQDLAGLAAHGCPGPWCQTRVVRYPRVVHHCANGGAEALAERHRRAEGRRPHAGADLYLALRPLRHARPAPGRHA